MTSEISPLFFSKLPSGGQVRGEARAESAPDDTARNRALRVKAAELETAFLAEMLGHAGLGSSRESFGGGIGEEQFASFLRQEQAAAMVKAGGIGLTERLFRAMGGRDAQG